VGLGSKKYLFVPRYLFGTAAIGLSSTNHRIWQVVCTVLPPWPNWPCRPIVPLFTAAVLSELVLQFVLVVLLPVEVLLAPQD